MASKFDLNLSLTGEDYSALSRNKSMGAPIPRFEYDFDKKRIQYKLEMIHAEKKYVAATLEALSLYVDLNERKVANFEDEKIKLMSEFVKKNKLNFNNEDLKFSTKLKK